jgi:hypothetical protein
VNVGVKIAELPSVLNAAPVPHVNMTKNDPAGVLKLREGVSVEHVDDTVAFGMAGLVCTNTSAAATTTPAHRSTLTIPSHAFLPIFRRTVFT